jgi:hypothetical protein
MRPVWLRYEQNKLGQASSIGSENGMNSSRESRLGSTIKLYLADGQAGGIRVVEKDNWSGVGVDCSRKDLARARRCEEFEGSGVYVLSDFDDDSDGLPQIYVGEAEDLGTRLATQKSWGRLVIFTSKDASINKAHAKYLESRWWECPSSRSSPRPRAPRGPASPSRPRRPKPRGWRPVRASRSSPAPGMAASSVLAGDDALGYPARSGRQKGAPTSTASTGRCGRWCSRSTPIGLSPDALIAGGAGNL